MALQHGQDVRFLQHGKACVLYDTYMIYFYKEKLTKRKLTLRKYIIIFSYYEAMFSCFVQILAIISAPRKCFTKVVSMFLDNSFIALFQSQQLHMKSQKVFVPYLFTYVICYDLIKMFIHFQFPTSSCLLFYSTIMN